MRLANFLVAQKADFGQSAWRDRFIRDQLTT
jgi:hypothetical protein